LVLTPLRQAFMKKLQRIIYHYGNATGVYEVLNRDDLRVIHSESMLVVELNGKEIVKHDPKGFRRTMWCTDSELKEAMDKIDRIFLLDDLAML
jgi:hypothetical protein